MQSFEILFIIFLPYQTLYSFLIKDEITKATPTQRSFLLVCNYFQPNYVNQFSFFVPEYKLSTLYKYD